MKKICLFLFLICCQIVFLAGCAGKEETTEKKADDNKKTAFVYNCDEKEIYIYQDINKVLEILGDDYEYFEAASCAMQGLDRFYYYKNLTLTANEIDGKIVLTDLYFKNDTVKTTEGLRFGDEYAQVLKCYGSDFDADGTIMEYDGGDMLLLIGMKDSRVVSIEYRYK